jgi:N-methylhydantoinase A
MNGAARTDETRQIFDGGLRSRVEAKVVARAELRSGMHVSGPGVIVEDQTSTIITSSFDAIMQPDGSLLLLRKQPEAGGAA